jgi:Mrp family chromosome partitioning ATPase
MSLSVLPSGASTKNPPDLLGSQRMRALLHSVRENYDLVIVDAPPVTAVIDSLVVAPHVDKIVFVIEWENTPREVVTRAMNVLGENRERVAGVLLNKVDLNQMRFRQSYYSYYNRRYGKYEKYHRYYDT